MVGCRLVRRAHDAREAVSREAGGARPRACARQFAGSPSPGALSGWYCRLRSSARVTDRLGDVRVCDGGCAGQVGDGTRDAQHAVVRASGQAEFMYRRAHQRLTGRAVRDITTPSVELGIDARPKSAAVSFNALLGGPRHPRHARVDSPSIAQVVFEARHGTHLESPARAMPTRSTTLRPATQGEFS